MGKQALELLAGVLIDIAIWCLKTVKKIRPNNTRLEIDGKDVS